MSSSKDILCLVVVFNLFFLWNLKLEGALTFCGTETVAIHKYAKAIQVEYREFLNSDHWGYDHVYEPDDNYNYDRYFASVLPEKSFSNLLKNRSKNQRGTNLLELFGSGVFVNLRDANSITGIRIQNKEFEAAPPDPATRRLTLPGNIFTIGTVRALEQSMKLRGIGNFDVIVVRPVQGLLSALATKDEIEFERDWERGSLTYLLNRLNHYYQHLSPNYGELFLEEKLWLNEMPLFERWIQTLSRPDSGVILSRGRSSAANNVLRITRLPDSNNRLPEGL